MDGNGSRAARRREAHAEDSRRAILDAARRVFALKGYADASLDDIVGPAGLTKGALYHHFKNKAALLEAVYVEMEEEVVERVQQRMLEVSGDDAHAQTVAALHAFFAFSAEPDYVRIVLRDAPGVLGHKHGRDLDEAIGLGVVRALVERSQSQGLLPALPVGATARMLLAAASEVAVTMAYAEDPEVAREEGTAVVLAVLEGLRLRAQAPV
jgi:AcrR family transcriptional regulator